MYSTIAISKSSKLTGRLIGTHQKLDLQARKILGKNLPRGRYFPSGKEIIYFEGTRGPDGLKRKSPGIDEPSHMLLSPDDASENTDNLLQSPSSEDHGSLDPRSVMTLIADHRWNLVQALRKGDKVRAAFEAAWMAHMITDGLTPAHHFPLNEVKEELMTNKDLLHVFGEPIKGVMHGRNLLETMRNNWLYWGAGGHMTQHIAYEYGVLVIAATVPDKKLMPTWDKSEFKNVTFSEVFTKTVKTVQGWGMYSRFRKDGWTTDLALETRDLLLPIIIKCVALGWFSACEEAYKLNSYYGKKQAE